MSEIVYLPSKTNGPTEDKEMGPLSVPVIEYTGSVAIVNGHAVPVPQADASLQILKEINKNILHIISILEK